MYLAPRCALARALLPMLALALVSTHPPIAAAYDNGAPASRLPILGWSTWEALGPGASFPQFDYCDTDSVMESMKAMLSPETGLADAGYRHVTLSDCWAGGRNESGHVFADTTRFPTGLQPLIDFAHTNGLTFGVYTCAGTTTCFGGRPGSENHWVQDAQSYAEWGVDWIKCDFCNHNTSQTAEEIYTTFSHALNASGRAMHLNMCEWGVDDPWTWGGAVSQSWRATGDHAAEWWSTQQIIQSFASIPPQYTGRPWGWNDADMLQTGNNHRAAHDHSGKRIPNMTNTEYVTEFSMWAIMASPLIVSTPVMNCTAPNPVKPGETCSIVLEQQLSHAPCVEGQSFGCFQNGSMWTNDCRGVFTCDGNKNVTCNIDGNGTHICSCAVGPATCVPYITPFQKHVLLNKEVIAINQDVTPQGFPVKGHEKDLYVWGRALSDGSVAVALYNQDSTATSIGIDDFSALPAVGWDASTKVTVRDLWKHADVGTFTGSYPAVSVDPHATVLLRLTKAGSATM